MCGRFTIKTPLQEIKEEFQIDEAPEDLGEARYNVAPTQPVPVVRRVDAGRRRLDLVRWGLIPFWARDAKIGYRTINARAETIDQAPAFRGAFSRGRRCLVIADGFYEWKKDGRKRFGYWIRRRDGRPFAMAGLWERWKGERRELEPPLETCTIITTDSNEVVAPIHDRMPVLLTGEDVARWLDPAEARAEALKGLLRPCPPGVIESVPVGTFVNDVRHEGPRCIEPFVEPPTSAPRGSSSEPGLFPGL